MTTQNQDQLSQFQDPNSMTHKTNPSKTQQDPNRMTDLKKSAVASVVEVDSLGSEEERRHKIHPCPPKPQAATPKSP